MKKRIMCIYLLVLLCVISICSCLNKTKLFNEQSNINLNYNNIIAYNSFWLTNDSICYLQDSLIQNYYMVTTKSKIKICQNGGMGYGKIQRYGQRIYLLDEIGTDDEFTSNFRLK